MTKQIKLLWLTENYFPNRGGMAQSCDRIVDNLRKKDVFIGVVHFRSEKNQFKFKKSINGFYLSFPVKEDDPAHTYNLLLNFIENPEFEFQFDYILAFGGYLPILGAPIISILLNVSLITMFRGNDFDQALFSAKKREFLFYAIRNSKKIITVTKEQKKRIELLLELKNVFYIANGIKLNDWKVLKSELNHAQKWKINHVKPNQKLIGVFGHLKAKKGLDFFMNSMRRSMFKDEIVLLITGEYQAKDLVRLKQYDINYQLLPFLDRAELLSYYPACDAVAIPSFYDGMPNVLLEAAALGVPLIAAKTGGMKDILQDGKHGFLFHPGDEQACSKAILQFMKSSPLELKTMSKNCKELILNDYTDEIEAENYLRIFT